MNSEKLNDHQLIMKKLFKFMNSQNQKTKHESELPAGRDFENAHWALSKVLAWSRSIAVTAERYFVERSCDWENIVRKPVSDYSTKAKAGADKQDINPENGSWKRKPGPAG